MKILRIKGRGEKVSAEYLKNSEKSEYAIISDVDKNDILNLLRYIYSSNNIEFDENVDSIKNEAEKIIYKELLKKFKDFNDNKDSLHNEIDSIYSEVEKKYELNDAD